MAHMFDAIIRLKDEFSGVIQNVTENMSHFQKQANYVARDTQKVGNSLQNIGTGLTTHITAPLTLVGGVALNTANEFSDAMAKVSTIADTTKVPIDELKTGIVDLSNKTGISVTELAEAQYQAISAGVDTAKSVEFLETATKASKGGFTDTTTAINGLTTVLNAYGLKTEEVNKVSDQMMVAQNFGKTSFGEMAQSMGNVIPIASSLNVSTEELFGSIAVLTKNGIATSESITGLKAAYSNILKPGSDAAKVAESLGLEFNGAHLKSVGWAKFLDEVKEKTGGNSEQMAKLFGSTEALNSIMVLTGKGASDFSSVLKQMKDSGGLTEEAFEKMQTPAEKFRQKINKAKNSLLGIGGALEPAMNTVGNIIEKITDKLTKLTPEQQQTIVKFGLMAVAVGPVLLVFGKITSNVGKTIKSITNLSKGIQKAGGIMSWLTSPGHIVIAIIGAIALAAVLVIKNWDKISATFKKVGDNIAKYTGISGKHVKSFIKIFENVIKKSVSTISKSVKSLAGKILPPIKEIIKIIATSIKELMPIIKPVLVFIAGVFVTGICGAFSIMGTVISAVVDVIGGVVGGLLKVFQGFLNFIIGVFTGNWEQAWEGVKQIFTGVIDILKSLWSGLVELLTAPVQAMIDILDSIFHEKIAGIKNAWESLKTFMLNPIQGTMSLIKNGDLSGIKADGKNALGTSYWGGGLSLVGEHGPEILELPKGSAVHDANTTKEMLTFKPKVQNTEQQSKGNLKVVIEKLADKIIVREEADIDKIADALVRKLEIQSQNI